MTCIAKDTANFHCPRWKELPGISLYMDQVLLVVNETLKPLLGGIDPGITAAMINNYVKQKLLSPPSKKKYERGQLSSLIMICILKRVLAISEIDALLASLEMKEDARYDLFCDALEAALFEGLDGGLSRMQAYCGPSARTTLCAALIAFAGHHYVERALLET